MPTERTGQKANQKLLIFCFAAAALLLLLPILFINYLPVLDAPAHEARVAALRNMALTGVGSRFYGLDTFFLPNLGFDLAGMVMTLWMSPALVGRVFFGITLALTLGGVAALSRVATGRWSPLPLAASLLLYNLFAILGFLNYQAGIALMFWALSARFLLERTSTITRFALGSLLGIALLFCHISAFGIYAVLLAGIGVDMALRRKEWLRACLCVAETMPAVVLFALMPRGEQERSFYDFPFWHAKIFSAVKSLSSGSMAGDAALVVGLAALALLLVAGGKIRLSRPLVPGIIMLAVLYFVIPPRFGSGFYVDSRLPVVIILVKFATIDFTPRKGKLVLALVLVATGAFAAKQIALTRLWYSEDAVITRIAKVFEALPDGAVILQAECLPDSDGIKGMYQSRQQPLTHIASIAAFSDRRYSPMAWALKGQQPLTTLPAYLPYLDFQKTIDTDTCSIADYRDTLEDARMLIDTRAVSGIWVPPVYLLLLRASVPHALAPFAPLVGETAEMELYDVKHAP